MTVLCYSTVMTVPPQEQYGRLWLHELTYGTEKQLQLHEFEKTPIGKTPSEIIAQKDEHTKRESKLSDAVTELQRLVGSEIMISTIEDQGDSEVVAGTVKKFNLVKGIITIDNEDGRQNLTYCRIEPDERFGQIIAPTVTMLAEQEYKF